MKTKTRRRQEKRHTRKRVLAREEVRAELPAYASFLFEPFRYKVLYGGRGAARSWTVARILLIRAAAKSMRILCTRELQTSIKDSVHQLLRDQIDLLGLKGFTVTHNEIRHSCGSLFLFEGLRHNITKIKSLEGIDICWVEEAERISKESWAVLIPTIRKERPDDPDLPQSEIWVTFNPDQESDSTYQRFIVNKPPRAFVKRTSWKDNPWLPNVLKEEKDYAYATDPDAADHIWGGDTRQITDAQILKGKFIVESFEPFLGHDESNPCQEMLETGKRDRLGRCPHGWGGPYQGQDFGFANDPAAGVRAWIYDNILYVEYELWRLHLENDAYLGAYNHPLEGIPNFAAYVIRADSARPDTISYLKRHGFPRIIGVVKGPNSIEEGIRHLRSYTRIVIHPRCKHMYDEAKLYSYKVDERSGDVLPIVVDKHNHLMDALRYALEPIMKRQRQVGVVFPTPRDTTGVQGAMEVPDPEPVSNGNGNGHPINRLIGINSR